MCYWQNKRLFIIKQTTLFSCHSTLARKRERRREKNAEGANIRNDPRQFVAYRCTERRSKTANFRFNDRWSDYVKCHTHFALIYTVVFDVVMWNFVAIALAFAMNFFVTSFFSLLILFYIFFLLCRKFKHCRVLLLLCILDMTIWKICRLPT